MLDRAIFLASDGTAPPLPEYSEPVHEGSGRTRPRVLVVDDEQLIAQTVAAILNANGFEAQEAYSGEEALAAAHRFQPDIVLTDVLMPRMTGVELGIRLRKELPATRVLLFSGQAATSELMQRAESEGHRFTLFPKPIHPEELIARLRGLEE